MVASLDTHLKLAGISTPPLDDALATAYENSLLYSEHTFGYYGRQPGGFWYGEEWKKKREEGRYAKFEQSFNDKRAYIQRTASIVRTTISKRMGRLAKNIDAKGPRAVVFNPLPWRRSGRVLVVADGGPWSAVRDLETGKDVPILGSSDKAVNAVMFEANDLPPSGHKTYLLISGFMSGSETLTDELIDGARHDSDTVFSPASRTRFAAESSRLSTGKRDANSWRQMATMTPASTCTTLLGKERRRVRPSLLPKLSCLGIRRFRQGRDARSRQSSLRAHRT